MDSDKVVLSLDESSKLINLSFKGPGQDDAEHEQMAATVKNWYEKLVAKYPDTRFKVLVDLTNAGIPNKSATDIYTKTLSDGHISRTAFYGVGPAIKSVINFIVSAAGKGDKVQFFIDPDKAKEWLLGLNVPTLVAPLDNPQG